MSFLFVCVYNQRSAEAVLDQSEAGVRKVISKIHHNAVNWKIKCTFVLKLKD